MPKNEDVLARIHKRILKTDLNNLPEDFKYREFSPAACAYSQFQEKIIAKSFAGDVKIEDLDTIRNRANYYIQFALSYLCDDYDFEYLTTLSTTRNPKRKFQKELKDVCVTAFTMGKIKKDLT